MWDVRCCLGMSERRGDGGWVLLWRLTKSVAPKKPGGKRASRLGPTDGLDIFQSNEKAKVSS